MTDSLTELAPRPPHVSKELVVDFDYMNPAGLHEVGVYQAMKKLHDGPDIIWSPRYGGHWMVTRAEDIQFVQENYQVFSHEIFIIPRQLQHVRPLPLAIDPPLHARYRAVINPPFLPKRIEALSDKVRALTVELIENLKPKGHCEFVNEFARIMPVTIFLGIVDLPLDRREEFVGWAIDVLTEIDPEKRRVAHGKVENYLQKVLDERYGGSGDDLLTRVVSWRDNPRFQDESEVMAMASLLFFGGLDTVASELSFITMHLAEHPDHLQRLRDEPTIIPKAMEEYLRRFGLSNTGRLITQDFEYKGVTFRKDEMIMVPINLSGIDDRLYDDPLEVDFDRDAPFHNTFGNGPHKCAGATLARSEIKIFLEEFSQRMPNFRIDPDKKPVQRCGSVPGLDSLHLRWD